MNLKARDSRLHARPSYQRLRDTVAVAATLTAILGVALTIYFYKKSERRRQLAYYVHPVRSAILKQGHASALTVLHNGREIIGDITVAHITLWNRGSEPIRKADILRGMQVQMESSVSSVWIEPEMTLEQQDSLPPLLSRAGFRTLKAKIHKPGGVIESEMLVLTPAQQDSVCYSERCKGVNILEAKIRKTSRDVVQFTIIDSLVTSREIPVSWNILEKDDGATIELIYEGDPHAVISVDGVIVGQSQITPLSFSGKIRTPEQQIEQWRKERWINLVGAVALLSVACSMLVAMFFMSRDDPRLSMMLRRLLPDKAFLIGGILVAATIIIYAVFMIVKLPKPYPLLFF